MNRRISFKEALKTLPFFASISFFYLLTPLIVYGQTPPPLPPSEQAGVVSERLKEEVEEALEKRRIVTKGDVEEELPESVVPKSKTPFFVSRIQLEGNSWVTRGELAPLLEPYENREVTLQDLDQLSREIEREYRRRGFLANYVYVPPQRMTEGIIVLRVIEGKVGNIYVEGNRWFRKSRILSYTKLKKGEVLHYSDLRRSLWFMNKNPDRSVNAVLRRGEEQATTDIIFNVKDRFPVHAGFSYDNYGSRFSGKNRYGFTLRNSNLLSFDDMLSAGVVFGSDFGAVFTQYLFPIPQTNTDLIFGFNHAQVAPKKEFRNFGVNGISQIYYGRIEQHLLEGNAGPVAYRAGLNLTLEFKDSRTKILSEPFKKERLRVLRFGPRIVAQDPWGSTQIDQELSFGLNVMRARTYSAPTAARQGVRPDFFRYRGNIQRAQKMPFDTRLNIRSLYQLGVNKLPASEMLYLGGGLTVRGYPEGDYLADNGLFLSCEYLIPTFFVPKDWQLPFSKIPLWRQLQWVTFLDQAYAEIRGALEKGPKTRYMLGVGGGIRVQLNNNLFFRIDWGQPIGQNALTGSTRGRVHFRLQTEF